MREKKTPNFSLEYETERLYLRVLTPEYLREVTEFLFRNRFLFEKYEPAKPDNFYTAEHQQALLKCEFNMALKMEAIRYYVFLKEDPDKIIGTVCLHDIRRPYYSCCEMGYKFDSDYHHMGYAREAVNRITRCAFEDLALHRIFARVMPENLPSINLLRSLDYVEEGIEHDCIRISDQWQDHLRFAKINPQ